MPDPTQHHPHHLLRSPDGERVPIDVDLAPLIQALWRHGIQTASCCQDLGESIPPRPHLNRRIDYLRGFSVIDLPIPDGLAVLSRAADAGPRDAFYERMTYWAAPDSWTTNVPVLDLSGGGRSAFALVGMQLVFPRADIAEFTTRVS
jgi:hypothetical protein